MNYKTEKQLLEAMVKINRKYYINSLSNLEQFEAWWVRFLRYCNTGK